MYAIEFSRSARKSLVKLPAPWRKRIEQSIESLAEDPRPRGCLRLTNRPGNWRIRVGDYRVIYAIHDDVLVIHVIRVSHRRDAYD